MPGFLTPACRRTLLRVALLLLCPPAFAQGAQAVARTPLPKLPNPLDASVAVPPLVYRSALGAYRRAGEVPVGDWREANDNVTRIGGWRFYTGEAQAPDSAPAATAPAPGPAASAAASRPAPLPAASQPAPLPAAAARSGHRH